jgi:hypothetical protein
MYDPPAYVWTVSLLGEIGIPAATCLLLYRGARSAGTGRSGATLLAGAAGLVLGGWLAVSAAIAAGGHYQTVLGKQPPWTAIALAATLVTLLALSRIPAVSRALAGPDALGAVVLPHTFRIAAVAFLMLWALGHMPALFAVPAAVGDIVVASQAPLVARRLARGTGHRGAIWFAVFGLVDLVVSVALGAVTGYNIVHVTPANDALAVLPIVLVPTVNVPLLLTLHIVSLRRLLAMSRAPQPVATAPAVAMG